MSLYPLDDRVLVRRHDTPETTVSGLYIPEPAREVSTEGEVLAVGPGRREKGQLVPMSVRVGDSVVFSKYGGTEVKVDGEELVLLQERHDVLAVLVEAEA